MSFIRVNVKQLISDRLFPVLRTIFNLDWHSYLNTLFDGFDKQINDIRDENLYLTNHTSQKISLEHLFNTVTDQNGNKLIVGSPVVCETSGVTPLFYFWTFEEREGSLVPDGVVGSYTYNNQEVIYDPTLAISWTDEELYDINGNIQIPYNELSWMFLDEDTYTNNYTIWVDPIDYVGFQGLDTDGNPIYAPNSKLDIIYKYAEQYTAVGVLFTITSR